MKLKLELLKLNNLTQLQNALAPQNLKLMQRAHLTLQVGLLQLVLQTLVCTDEKHIKHHEGLWWSRGR